MVGRFSPFTVERCCAEYHALLECVLPPLSDLLKNERIRDTDSLVICVQMHCPVGPFYPQQPSVYYVPRELLDGLEASLDNASKAPFQTRFAFPELKALSPSLSDTGDVRFICLERLNPNAIPTPLMEMPDASTSSAHLRSPSSSTSSIPPFTNETTARKRIIYAHSDILTRRSDYFATMLSSSFSENATATGPGDRKIYTITVEEADFETIYWLLKFCYANWLLFRQHDDPREAVDGAGAGWSAKWLGARGSEWDWKTFRKSSAGDENLSIAGDTRSATSLSNGEAGRSTSNARASSTASPARPNPSSATKSSAVSNQSSTSVSRTNNPNPRRSIAPGGNNVSTTASSAGGGNGIALSSSNTSGAPRGAKGVTSGPVPIIAPSSGVGGVISHYPPVSPRTTRQPHQHQHPSHLIVMTPDPHPHPTPAPPPASALSIYQVAHRYAIPGLANLALDHMMSTITPQSAFALLLATSAWDELKSLAEVSLALERRKKGELIWVYIPPPSLLL